MPKKTSLESTCNDYKEIEQIGEGSYATVWDVKKNGIHYAKKVYLANENITQGFEVSDLIELNILGMVNHPNILGAESITIDKQCNVCLILPLEHGELKEINDVQLVLFINQLLCGLKYLKDNYILHLDIKPENILISKNKKKC